MNNNLLKSANTIAKQEGGFRLKNIRKKSSLSAPLISIITVVYNGEKHLEQTIHSVINQSYTNIEYIIVDGGSVDDTLSIIKKFDNNIDYWLSEPDKGISDAFNKGISLATGDFVGIINADDWYEPDTIQIVADCFKKDSSTGVVCGYVKYWSENKEDYIFTSNPDLLHKTMTVNHPTVFVEKSVYKKYGVFSSRYKYAMDYELMLRFKSKGVKFRNIDKVLANMRLGGASDKTWLNTYKEVRKIKLQYFNVFEVNLYFYKQILSRSVSKIFTEVGLDSIIKYYRKNFSLIKKHK